MGNYDYNLSFGDLKEQSGFKGSIPTLHKYRKIGLIDCKEEGRRYLYSSLSVKQLKLIPELKKYALDEDEIKETFKKVPLDILIKKVGKVAPDELYKIITGCGVKLDLKWPYSPKFS